MIGHSYMFLLLSLLCIQTGKNLFYHLVVMAFTSYCLPRGYNIGLLNDVITYKTEVMILANGHAGNNVNVCAIETTEGRRNYMQRL